MTQIAHVELTDTFNTQRERINDIIDQMNAGQAVIPGDGITLVDGAITVKKTGDGLSFDSSHNLVGNDAYPNLMTQVIIDPSAPSIVPNLVTTTTITFPAFSVLFAKKVYYGTKISDYTRVNVPITTMTVDNGVDGAVFVYVDNTGAINQTTIPLTPANSSVQCLLGSYFRLNNQIQPGSWKYTPWNGATSKDTRFASGALISGGLITINNTTTLKRASISVIQEGVNISNSVYNPNSITYAAEAPYTAKELWPGYDANVTDSSVLDTWHVYNMTNNRVDSVYGQDGYIVLIPGIISVTGQDIYLMAMSPYESGEYTQIFPTMNDAINSVYGLQFDLGTVTTRVSWLGQAIVVKIGATDFTNPEQVQVIGQLPNSLGSYTAASGSGSSTKINGLTVKVDSNIIGNAESKSSINFVGSFTGINTSDSEVEIGLDNGNLLQQHVSSVWPSSTNPDVWPHTLKFILDAQTTTIPSTVPTYTNKILTWELLIENPTNAALTLTWPAVYVGFNSEALPDTAPANSTIFLMLRRYSNDYVLVSKQGIQGNSLI